MTGPRTPTPHHDPIDLTRVRKVYSGRPGCMCGCRGKYTYATRYSGFSPVSDTPGPHDGSGDCNKYYNNAVVARITKTVERLGYLLEDNAAYVETATRSYCIYFMPVEAP